MAREDDELLERLTAVKLFERLLFVVLDALDAFVEGSGAETMAEKTGC